MISRLSEARPDLISIPGIEEMPIYSFLSRIKTTPSMDGRLNPLTPEILQPDPTVFWNQAFEPEPVILLYPQRNSDSPMDGGVILDLQTLRVIWHRLPGPPPPRDEWTSLLEVLQAQWSNWETGKFMYDPAREALVTLRWTQHELAETLSTWNDLLSAIEEAMARNGFDQSGPRLEALNFDANNPFHLSKFARAFLSQAPRPNFKYVAPGVQTFNTALLHEIYSSEGPNSMRSRFELGEEDDEDWVSLILPAVDTVPKEFPRNSNSDVKSFDKDWGFGKFTINRRAGLYTDTDNVHSNAARFITSSGASTTHQFAARCLWGPSRPPSFTNIFRLWTTFVRDGSWTVNQNGVTNDNHWFDNNSHRLSFIWASNTLGS